MRATYSINGRKISKKDLVKLIGKEQVDSYTKDAKKTFIEDPNISYSVFICRGMLNIGLS